MKVGTDGVLLGAWATITPDVRRILDIGTGTGLIALMAAQRTANSPAPATVVGVDIDSTEDASANAAASPWSGRIRFERCPIQQFPAPAPFDLILSNPPYFESSLTSPDAGRTLARHTASLSFEELCAAVCRLLAPGGRFALILPTTEAAHFCATAEGRLALVRRAEVRTTPRRAPKRVLMEFVAAAEAPEAAPALEEITIGTGEHECYTEEYRRLTRDFYLKF